jgi:hypothetical protein
LFIMLAEGVKLCLVLCFNLYLHHLPETPIEPRKKASSDRMVF